MTTWGWKMSDRALTAKIRISREPAGTVQRARCYIRDYNENGRSRKRMAELEIFRNALGRCAENMVSGNGRAVASGVAGGNVNAGAHKSAGRARGNASPDSGWPKYPDTDYHLPQMRHGGACSGAPC